MATATPAALSKPAHPHGPPSAAHAKAQAAADRVLAGLVAEAEARPDVRQKADRAAALAEQLAAVQLLHSRTVAEHDQHAGAAVEALRAGEDPLAAEKA